MADAILVLNAGSSSIKFSVFVEDGRGLEPLLRGQIEGLFTAPRFEAKDAEGARIGGHAWPEGTRLGHQGALEHLVAFVRAHRGGHGLRAVGHRVVHGGQEYSAPVRIDAAVLTALEKLVPLAPLHQPHNLAPIRTLLTARPGLPQVACFDTAFHRSQPATAQAFALPADITERGVRRYGFHGLSYAYIASVLANFDARAAAGRTVVLTTHNMALADELCDRVALIVEGRIAQIDAPRALRLRYGAPRVRVEYLNGEVRAAEFPLAGLAENAEFQRVLREAAVRLRRLTV